MFRGTVSTTALAPVVTLMAVLQGMQPLFADDSVQSGTVSVAALNDDRTDSDLAAASTGIVPVRKPPKIILISLDGAQPDLIRSYLNSGKLPADRGIGLIRSRGVSAVQNITATPSLTAVSHVAIATGSTAVHNDIPANTFHPVAATIGSTISGFAAPIGGYDISPLGPTPTPTAEPMWLRLREAGKKVVTATWPGSDGADIAISGVPVQAAVPTRTNDYTLPFGAFGGLSATGFTLSAVSFAADPTIGAQLTAAGHPSYSPAMVTTTPIETVYCADTTFGTCGTQSSVRNLKFEIKVAAIDSKNDGVSGYDTLVFFDTTHGIAAGPFPRPSTGPAYVQAGQPSQLFYFEGTGNKIGTAFYATTIAPDLSSVRFARYAANYIPRNTPALAAVDDINNTIGFWQPQPDFRIPERLSVGFGSFSDLELEAMYEDQVDTWTTYQMKVAHRAIKHNPGADLVMLYFEQPDGSSHQFMLTDPRQASNFLDPTSIGTPGNPPGAIGQDPAKVARYARYMLHAYRKVNAAVRQIISTVGVTADGTPRSNIFVVSDHGFAPFHSAVNLTNLLVNAGIDRTLIAVRTSGPAANIYVNLAGREAGGTVAAADYQTLVTKIADTLRAAQDTNPDFNYSLSAGKVFAQVATRPIDCAEGVGFCTNDTIGQDSGDVFAILDVGYNFDGTQFPGVARLGDPAYDAAKSVFSVSNFYGAHGHDSELPSMSASFYAAGPMIKPGVVASVRNIDVAPTIMHMLGVETASTVDGRVLTEILK